MPATLVRRAATARCVPWPGFFVKIEAARVDMVTEWGVNGQ